MRHPVNTLSGLLIAVTAGTAWVLSPAPALAEAPEPEVTREEAAPEEATPEEATPEEAAPEEATPEEATPEEAAPEEAAPEEAAPEEAAPEEAAPEEAAPEEAAPEEAAPEEAAPEEAEAHPYITTDPAHAPWRGSRLSLKTGVAVMSFDPGADLTYNPEVGLGFSGRLRWWLLDKLYVQTALGLSRELTKSDSTTYAQETLVGDMTFRVGAPGVLTIPVVDIDISAGLGVRLPTSKASIGKTLRAAVGLDVSLSRSFDLLKGLNLTYEFSGTRLFHAYTTGELVSPRISHCVGVLGECDRFLSTGVRNVQWQLTNAVAASVQFFEWLGVATQVIWISHRVYPSTVDTSAVSYVPQEPTEWRHYLAFGVEASLTPIPWLTVALGASTQAPQLAPDSKPYTPLFNRYTSLQLDLRLDIARLIDAFVPAEPSSDSEEQQ